MKIRFSLLLALLCCLASAVQLNAQSTAFSYQGLLTTNGGPANGSHDFQFTLFAAPSGGNPMEDPVALSAVGVTNGLFTVALDYGANVFNGPDRWLDIAVRPAGNGTFTPLSPRQPITTTPYAVTALNVPGISGSSLNSANNGPLNVVVVDNLGKVGVGTTSPVSQLHVTSKPNEAPPRLQSSGNADFSAGWDFYHGTTGKGYVGVPDANASIAPGELVLFGGAGTKVSLWAGQTRALTVMPDGDVQLGANGQFHAASGEENLRIVRGTVAANGTILQGAGFTVSHTGKGIYDITFSIPFPAPPTVSGVVEFTPGDSGFVMTDGVSKAAATLKMATPRSLTFEDNAFHFIAIGTR